MSVVRAGFWRWGCCVLMTCQLKVASAAWYQVEVIAFRYPQAEESSWSAAKTLPDLSTAVRLAPAEQAPEPAAPLAYQALASHELKLAGAYQALARSGNLERLFHVGWRQRDEDSRAVFLSTADPAAEPVTAPPAVLAGTVRISPGRSGFQLVSNFIVQQGETPIALAESRKIALGELHYLDHPLVGLLIQMTALDPAVDTNGDVLPSTPASPSAADDAD